MYVGGSGCGFVAECCVSSFSSRPLEVDVFDGKRVLPDRDGVVDYCLHSSVHCLRLEIDPCS